MISYFKVANFNWATGIILLANTKAIPVINTAKNIKGFKNLKKEIPADLMATNSKFSPKFPSVMIDESSMANGNASGTAVAEKNTINLMIVPKSNPLPTKSSIYNQKNCITKTKSEIKNVAKKGPMKERSISMSSFFITLAFLYKPYYYNSK